MLNLKQGLQSHVILRRLAFIEILEKSLTSLRSQGLSSSRAPGKSQNCNMLMSVEGAY